MTETEDEEETLTAVTRFVCLSAALMLAAAAPALSDPSGVPVVSRPVAKPRAELIHTTFVTSPPGADLKANGSFIGKSGQPLEVDTAPFGSTISLTVSYPGYQDTPWVVPLVEAKKGRVPLQGEFQLKPAGWRGLVQEKAGWLLACAAVALLSGAFGFRQRRQVQELARRENLLSQVDRKDSLTAQRLGGYRLMNILGRGGMATVYRAVPDATMDESEAVAIKVLRREVASDSEFMERFRSEAEITSRMDHPNILRVIDWGSERSYVWLAIELMEGGDLRSRMTRQPLPLSEVWLALQPIFSALTYAHNQGVVHRDLKPENLMVTRSGILKVSDFGLARAEDQDRITATGTTLGTPAYMAPEQIQGWTPQPSMDQYAIGVITYELLTGRLPFTSSDPIQLIFHTMSDTPPAPSTFAQVSPALDALVLKMLAKRPEQRFASLQDAADALQVLVEN